MEAQEFDEEESRSAIRIKVVGVGGAGSNIVDRLALSGSEGVELVAVNTDQQALAGSPVIHKLCIGKSITGGLGTGGDAEAGCEAAMQDLEAIDEVVAGVDLLFLTAGLGGGTGTGAAPVIAERAMRQGAVVFAFVALPFSIERSARANTAQEGLRQLRDTCNAVVPLPNDLLIQESDADASLLDAFSKADAWIEKAIKSIWLMLNKTGLINLDFAQLRQTFSKKAGKTLFGIGRGEGENAAAAAVADLKLCPLLHTPEFSKLADQLLVNIIGGPGIGIADTRMIMETMAEEFGAESDLVMGAVIDETLGDSVEICVLGTSEVSSIAVSRVVKKRPLVAKPKPEESGDVSEATGVPKARPVTHQRPKKVEQHEFAFSDDEPKGEFENSIAVMFEGQDLDSPTYLRRGVKIVL